MSYRAEIQGLRALAVLMVVAFHAGLPTRGGFAGVDVFFVISGYVIGRLLLVELAESGRIALLRFAEARARRLLPALAVVLAVSMLAAALIMTSADLGFTVRSAVAAVAAVANLFFYRRANAYFGPSSDEIVFLHTWTLSVEMQFYVLAPLVLLVCWWAGGRIGRRGWLVGAVIGVATLGSFALAQLLAGGTSFGGRISAPETLAFYGTPTRAWEFLLGSAIALVEPRLLGLRRARAGAMLAVSGLLAVLATPWVAGETGPVPGMGVVVPALGAAFVIAGTTLAPKGAVARILSWRPLTALGDRSYSWYLWHWPVLVIGAMALPGESESGVTLVALAVGSFVPAWLSYRYVEQRFRHRRAAAMRPKGSRGLVFVVAGAAGLVLATAAVASAIPRSLEDGVGIRDYPAAFDEPALVESGGCLAADGSTWTLSSTSVARCSPDAPPSARRVLLIGDSQADAYAYGLRAAAGRLGLRLDVEFRNSCLVLPVPPIGRSHTAGPECQATIATIADALRSDPPDLLVISQSLTYDSAVGAADDPIASLPPEAQTRVLAANYRKGFTRLLRPLSADVPVLFLMPIPVMAVDGRSCGGLARLRPGGSRRCLEKLGLPRGSARAQRADSAMGQAIAAIVAARPQTTVFDPDPWLCSPRWCPQVRAGALVYRNENHLSAQASRDLAPELVGPVRDALTGSR